MSASHDIHAYLRDGQPVGESDFTRAACDPTRSVVVEACAGSGKTWLLVARLVRLLLGVMQVVLVLQLVLLLQ